MLDKLIEWIRSLFKRDVLDTMLDNFNYDAELRLKEERLKRLRDQAGSDPMKQIDYIIENGFEKFNDLVYGDVKLKEVETKSISSIMIDTHKKKFGEVEAEEKYNGMKEYRESITNSYLTYGERQYEDMSREYYEGLRESEIDKSLEHEIEFTTMEKCVTIDAEIRKFKIGSILFKQEKLVIPDLTIGVNTESKTRSEVNREFKMAIDEHINKYKYARDCLLPQEDFRLESTANNIAKSINNAENTMEYFKSNISCMGNTKGSIEDKQAKGTPLDYIYCQFEKELKIYQIDSSHVESRIYRILYEEAVIRIKNLFGGGVLDVDYDTDHLKNRLLPIEVRIITKQMLRAYVQSDIYPVVFLKLIDNHLGKLKKQYVQELK